MINKLINKKVKVYIFLGQSNEDGSTNTTPHSEQYLGYLNSFIFHKPDNSSTNNGNFFSYKWGVNNNTQGNLFHVCPQTSFGKYMYDQTGETIFMIKYSKGGSALIDRGTPYANGNWEVNANPANGTKHYNIAINNFIIPAIQLLKNRNVDFEICNLFWCQGESEAFGGLAEFYEPKLIELINKLIEDLTPFNCLSQKFKPIITRIHNNFNPVRPYTNEVRAAQINVANYYNAPWVDSDSYPVIADNVHWNNIGQEQHGIDRGNIIINQFL